jgi:hypothetical protein
MASVLLYSNFFCCLTLGTDDDLTLRRHTNCWAGKQVSMNFSPSDLIGMFMKHNLRYNLTSKEDLYKKVLELSDCTHQLEEVVEILQTATSNKPHVLLSANLLQIKESAPEGFYYKSATLLGPLPMQQTPLPGSNKKRRKLVNAASTPGLVQVDMHNLDVGPEILKSRTAFLSPSTSDLVTSITMRKHIREALPPQDEARRICAVAEDYVLWQYV